MENVTIVECPRDAMQGWSTQIATEAKIEYLNALLKVGFPVLDCGSFVSAKAIPQMADTKQVLRGIQFPEGCATKLLAIVANKRGAEEALAEPNISFLGYPFSISPTFQRLNTNAGIAESFLLVNEMLTLCHTAGKELVVYISMAFGNPYQDYYVREVAYLWVKKLVAAGVKIISLADTVGLAKAAEVAGLFTYIKNNFPNIELGLHLHANPLHAAEKLQAAWNAGCRRFDGALRGIGGCPMAQDDLVGNIKTESLVHFLKEMNACTGIDTNELENALQIADTIFY